MSFGAGAGDIITLSRLAWSIYKTCKESSDDFKRVSTEVASLHVILKETEEFLHEDNGLSDSRRSRLATLIETSTDVLNDLKKQLSSYESLGTHSQRTWDRLRWGLEDIADVRSRLISVNTTLAAFNSSLTSSSQARIEKKLEKFIAEVRAGFREGSVVSTHHPEALDNSDSWNELQRELEDIGISAGMVSEHQDYIKSWFKEAIASGLLDEGSKSKSIPSDDSENDNYSFPRPLRSRMLHSSSAATIANMASVSSASSSNQLSAQTTLVNDPSSIQPRDLAHKPSFLRSRTMPQEIDALLSHDDPLFPNLPPPTRSDTAASHSPAMLLRKYSLPSLLLFRLFQTDTKLIEAASDGSMERVATLLSRGANVNIRDKWGWTALSMAAYGGHENIAKLLLACGADMDIADVDGDLPLDLATNRGHAGVVIAIEEERANRVVRGVPEAFVPALGKRTKPAGGGGAAEQTAGDPAWKGSSATSVETPGISPLSRTGTGISPLRVTVSPAKPCQARRHCRGGDDDDDDDGARHKPSGAKSHDGIRAVEKTTHVPGSGPRAERGCALGNSRS